MEELLRIAVRVAHLLAATTWIGGAIFYALALRPAIPSEQLQAVNSAFRSLVQTCVWTLLLTGAILTFDRLTDPRVPPSYAVTLGVKAMLSAWLFYLAGIVGLDRLHRARARGGRPPQSPKPRIPTTTLILVLGLLVFVLGAALTVIYQRAVASS